MNSYSFYSKFSGMKMRKKKYKKIDFMKKTTKKNWNVEKNYISAPTAVNIKVQLFYFFEIFCNAS